MMLAVLAFAAAAAAAVTQAASPGAAPAASPSPTGPVVVLETSLGPVRIRLNPEKAPRTVDNFIQYVKAGHYDGTVFHRVMPGFMIQGGGMDANMKEKPTRPPIRNEAKNGLRNSRGTLSMARTSDPDSATSQFFINVADNAALDFGIRGAGYAVFADVIEGMDVVDRIVAVPTTTRAPHANVPVTPVVIKSARLEGGAVRVIPATKVTPGAAAPRAAPARPAAPKPAPRPRPSPSP
jgi:cyclophilin family peptidyl-prolyl cis-trans isomerase